MPAKRREHEGVADVTSGFFKELVKEDAEHHHFRGEKLLRSLHVNSMQAVEDQWKRMVG